MFNAKLKATILAIVIFMALSPVYKLISRNYAEGNQDNGQTNADKNRPKRTIFFAGKYYDQTKTQALERRYGDILGSIQRQRLALDAQINDRFDYFVSNVDNFLDWFYDLQNSSLYSEPIKEDSVKFLKYQLALRLQNNFDQNLFLNDINELNNVILSLNTRLAELQSELAACEVPSAAGRVSDSGPGPGGGSASGQALTQEARFFPQGLIKSQEELVRLGQGVKGLEGELLALGPGSPLIETISNRDSFVVAKNVIAYPASNPDLRQLINRQKFREEILESIELNRKRTLEALGALGPAEAITLGPADLAPSDRLWAQSSDGDR
ncbi:MAG: hypothetical protein LBF38_10625 [Deltaproteobacteria bacterium]|jgi:hypothetical protein|nr:hypothetical protein [Deltaproteobacteria bacterium]